MADVLRRTASDPPSKRLNRVLCTSAPYSLGMLTWSPWWPLATSPPSAATANSGLYRVRITGSESLAYVGQTSRLDARIRNLRSVYSDEMPLSDPHTAAPCLWVARTVHGAEFEVSIATMDGDVAERKALECLEISGHRERYGCSPLANFGRMPDGWAKPSGNNSRLVRRGGIRPGFQDPTRRRSRDWPSVLDRQRSPQNEGWAQLEWSPWSSLDSGSAVRGVYRIRHVEADCLTYVGQGQVASRLRAHLAKSRAHGHRQRYFFTDAVASWVEIKDAAPEQLLEIECDLIASHVLYRGQAPDAQFLG